MLLALLVVAGIVYSPKATSPAHVSLVTAASSCATFLARIGLMSGSAAGAGYGYRDLPRQSGMGRGRKGDLPA